MWFLCVSFLRFAQAVPPLPPAVTEVAGGFSWIENLCFDGKGHMFASERLRGQILSFTSNEKGGYNQTILLQGMFSLLLGCVTDEARHPGIVFVAGEFTNGSSAIVAVPTNEPASWQVVKFTPHVGNGIRIYNATGLLYTSTEGNFLPGGGFVYEVDLSHPWTAGNAIVLVDKLWACDGLWIDQPKGILYVGLLFTAEIWTYDLIHARVLGVYPGLQHDHCGVLQLCALDDFTLDHNSSWLIGTAWTNNSLTRFPAFSKAPGYDATTVLHGIQNPTSVRWGEGTGFSPTSLFISEGGGLEKGEKQFRILEWKVG